MSECVCVSVCECECVCVCLFECVCVCVFGARLLVCARPCTRVFLYFGRVTPPMPTQDELRQLLRGADERARALVRNPKPTKCRTANRAHHV